MMNKFKALVTEEQGQGLTEYGLVLGIIAVAVVGIIAFFRDEIVNIYTEAANKITQRNTANFTPTP